MAERRCSRYPRTRREPLKEKAPNTRALIKTMPERAQPWLTG